MAEVLRSATQVPKQTASTRLPECDVERLYWALLAMRAIRSRDSALLRKACKAYPILAPEVDYDMAIFTHTTDFHNHLTHLANTNIESQRIQLELDNDTPEWRKAGQREALRRSAMAWSPVRKRTAQFSIRDSAGQIASDPTVTARLPLGSHFHM